MFFTNNYNRRVYQPKTSITNQISEQEKLEAENALRSLKKKMAVTGKKPIRQINTVERQTRPLYNGNNSNVSNFKPKINYNNYNNNINYNNNPSPNNKINENDKYNEQVIQKLRNSSLSKNSLQISHQHKE